VGGSLQDWLERDVRRARRSVAREVVIGVGAYAAYLAVRGLVVSPEGRRTAQRNAERVLGLERRLGIAVEPALQRVALERPRVVHLAGAGYAVFNVGITLGLLMTLFRARDPGYRRFRRAVVLAHAGALPVFAVAPTSPPRTLDGFVDTLAIVSGIDLERPALVRFYNPIAAMPSQHLSFAVVTSSLLVERSRGTPGRAAARLYPPLVAIVVVATGNHFVLDVLAGAGLGALAWRLA
jgi:membrane-associated phospholipid phosphatase